eukprot:3862444-Pleurochrysis_carterae.AAC.1
MAAEDVGDGALVACATNIRTLADVADEIPIPPQSLPRYGARYAFAPLPERPMPLCTAYLARLPPQQLPG